jgi:hypothetical protein
MLIEIIQVNTYIEPSTKSDSDLKVQIIEYENEPIAEILTGFYATHLTNIITCTTAYSVFPTPTFVHHKSHLLGYPNHLRIPVLKEEWQSRDWEFHEPLRPEEDNSPAHSFQRSRRIGDRYPWKIFLGTPDPGFLSAYASRIDAAQNIVIGMKKVKDWRCKSETAPVFSHYEIKVST